MLSTLRQKIVNAPMAPQQNLTGKVALVTGCSENSLGFATATTLLQWGATLIITKRNNSEVLVPKLLEAAGINDTSKLIPLDLDISNSDSIKYFCEALNQAVTRLDILVNNAGIHYDLMSKWTEPMLSDDGFEIQWRTNYMGTTELTLSLLPLLKETAKKTHDVRIVNVVSMLHDKGLNADFFADENTKRPYNSWHAYGQSKLGLVHFTQSIDEHYKAQGISSFCLHPGAVFTNVASKGLSGSGWVEKVRNFFAPIEAFFLMTPKEGAQTQILCATQDITKLSSGGYYRDCKPAQASDEANSKETREQLWAALTS